MKNKLDYSLLNLSKEQEEQVKGLIEGRINPDFYDSVQRWTKQCYHPPQLREKKLCAINEAMEGYGVEVIEGHEWTDSYFGNILAEYVNMGDTYVPTVMFSKDDGWLICSWGDWVENHMEQVK